MTRTFVVLLTFELVVRSDSDSEAVIDAAQALKAMPLGELVGVVVEQEVNELRAH
jgi:hypothetical protein